MRAEDESEYERQEKKSEELTSTSAEMWSVSRMKAERARNEGWKNLNNLKSFLERDGGSKDF